MNLIKKKVWNLLISFGVFGKGVAKTNTRDQNQDPNQDEDKNHDQTLDQMKADFLCKYEGLGILVYSA